MSKLKKKTNRKNVQQKQKKRLVTREKQLKIDHKKSTFFMVIFVVIFVIAFVIALLWTARIQFTHSFDGVDLNEYAQNIYTQRQTEKASRGNIVDSNGEPLAVNIKTYNLTIVLNNGEEDGVMGEKDREAIYEILVDDLNLEKDEDAKDLIKTQVSMDNSSGYTQVEIGIYGKSLSIEQKEKIESDAKKADVESAFYFTENVERFYPYGDFASYVLGFYMRDSDGEDNPQIGVERTLQGYLAGRNGEKEYLSDNNNIPINQEQSSVLEKIDGSDVTLTLDSQIQSYIQTFQDKYLESADLDEEMAFTIVMDADDGGILGAYATPSFDPNYRNVQNYVNPFTEFCYEPGSTIKSFVLAAAMEEGVWNPNNINSSGIREESEWGEDAYVADWLYNEYYEQTWGPISWEQGYWYSANTIMTYIEDAIGDETWLKYLTETFGFGTSVNSQFMNTSTCSVKPEYPLDYANTSFGQGMTANSLQLLRAYSAIANDGVMVQPHIVEKMTDADTNEEFYTDEDDPTLDTEQVISTETAHEMLEEMEQAVYYEDPEGRGIYDAVAAPFGKGETKIGAKTGTAQVASSSGGYAKDGDLIYSVMALAPIDDPEILVYTAVVSPKDSSTDAMANYVTKIIDYSLNHLNKSAQKIDLGDLDNNRYQLENYVGKDVEESKAELEDAGIKVITLGDGKIASQYPSSQVISKDDTVILRGVGDVDYAVLEGTTYNEADGICRVMNWECEFNGIGDVKKVEQERETKYTLTLDVPDKLKKETEESDD